MSGHADGTHSQESDMLFVLALCGFSGALYPWLSRKRSPLARFPPKYDLRSPLWPHTVSQKTAQPAAGAKLKLPTRPFTMPGNKVAHGSVRMGSVSAQRCTLGIGRMIWVKRSPKTRCSWTAAAWAMVVLFVSSPALAQSDEYGICKPVSARTGEYGCWIVAQQPLGELTSSQVF